MQQCPPGQVSIGGVCRTDCSVVGSRAQAMIPELRSARQNRDEACRQDASGMACAQAGGDYQALLSQYEALLAGAPAECRRTLPDGNSI